MSKTCGITEFINVLASTQEDKIFKAAEITRKLNVESLDESYFSINYVRNMTYTTDLIDNTCTYSLFQLESSPCNHTIMVAIYRDFAV